MKHSISKRHKHSKYCLMKIALTRAPCVALSKSWESYYLCFSSYKGKKQYSICKTIGYRQGFINVKVHLMLKVLLNPFRFLYTFNSPKK